MGMRKMRHVGLLVPGAVTALFAVSAIVLPVGSDGLGAGLGYEPGAAPALARWARDIHDGFWRSGATPGCASVRPAAATSERLQAQVLLRMDRAEEALDIYQRIGVATTADQTALFDAFETMIVNGEYDRGTRYARAADSLLGGGTLRNNLAWHLTQVNREPGLALELALESVATGRNACNVDTLAWAWWRNGETTKAVETARETATFSSPWISGFAQWEEAEARESSERLLQLIGSSAR